MSAIPYLSISISISTPTHRNPTTDHLLSLFHPAETQSVTKFQARLNSPTKSLGFVSASSDASLPGAHGQSDGNVYNVLDNLILISGPWTPH